MKHPDLKELEDRIFSLDKEYEYRKTVCKICEERLKNFGEVGNHGALSRRERLIVARSLLHIAEVDLESAYRDYEEEEKRRARV